MNDKIHKIVTVYKRDGFIETTKKIYKHIKYTVFFKHNPLYLIDFVFKKNKYKNDLNNIFNKKYDRIIIWRGSFGW
ncbi:MAG: hypothetical protein RSB72_02530, partial [Bacilli bacterium]